MLDVQREEIAAAKIKRKKEIDGSGHRKENHVYYRNAL